MKLKVFLSYFLVSVFSLSVGQAETSPEPSATNCTDLSQLIPTCLENRTTPQTPLEMLETDLAVCKCIQSSPLINAVSSESSKSEEEEIRKTLARIKATGDAHRTGLYSDSLTYAKKSRDTEVMALTLTGSGDRHLEADVIKKLSPNSSTPELSSIDSKITDSNIIREEEDDWQCVTYSEYNALRTLPQSSSFYEDLQNAQFNPEKWNIETLAQRYDTTTGADAKAEIAERILFLQRNPHIKNIFKASPFGDVTASQIQAKQQSVYESIRTLLPAQGSSCLNNNSCDVEALRNGNYENFRTRFNELLVEDPLIHDISNQVSREEREAQINEIMADSQGSNTDLGRYFYYLQNTNENLSRRCSERESNAECFQSFQSHCSSITQISALLKQGYNPKGADVVNRAREQNMSETSLDLRANVTFDRFNDQICHQVFANSAGEALNFFGFRDRFCSGESPIPECSSRTALLSKYLREYTEGEGEEVIRNRSLVSELVNSSTFISANRQTVATANLLDETPSQLRERFGGSYPRIGSDGQLLPPLPSSGGREISRGSESSATPARASSSGVVLPPSVSNTSAAFTSSSPSSSPYSGARARTSATSANQSQAFRPETSSTPSFEPTSFSPTRRPASVVSDSSPSDIPDAAPAENRPEINQPSDPLTTPQVSSRGTLAAPASSGPSASAESSDSSTKAPQPGGTTVSGNSQSANPSVVRRNSALLDIYEGSGDMQILPLLEMKSYTLPAEAYSRVLNDPQLLSKIPKVSDAVKNAKGKIVEVTLLSESGQEFKVFGRAESSGIFFYESLYGATKKAGASPLEGASNFRLQVKRETYDIFRSSPGGILMNSEIYGRILETDSSNFKILLTSEQKDPITLYITKEDGNISVQTRSPASGN